MKKFIIEDFVNSTKLAIVEDETLKKIIIDEKNSDDIIKNIYRGIVKKVLPGIEACFVDIGEDELAYLKIKNNKMNEGDRVLVQVVKEKIGNKRAKLSTEISLSKRGLVYIPSNDRIAFSGKIEDKKVRHKLQSDLLKILEDKNIKAGFIARTEAPFMTTNELHGEVEELHDKYLKILSDFNSSYSPKLLYKFDGTIISTILNSINPDIDKVICNEGVLFDEIKSILKGKSSNYYNILRKEKGIDIFEVYGVNNKIKKYISKKVWLSNGSYFVIDKTEAMTVIDVNSGRYKGESSYENTVYDVNIAVAEEIAKHIMMRDISGIVVIDFIDMKHKKKYNEVLNTIKRCFSEDGNRSKVYGFSALGLLEMARRREGNSLESYYYKDTRGEEYSANYIIDQIEKKAINTVNHSEKKKISVCISSDYYSKFIDEKSKQIQEIENKYKIIIEVKENNIDYDIVIG